MLHVTLDAKAAEKSNHTLGWHYGAFVWFSIKKAKPAYPSLCQHYEISALSFRLTVTLTFLRRTFVHSK